MGKEQIKVELVDHMGSDLSTVNSARVSFDKESKWFAVGVDPDGNEHSFLNEGDCRLIEYLAKHRHTTPFRHNQIQIRCHAPIFLARQLGKHQAGLSWNEVSRRYVDDAPTFYIPDEWRGRPEGSVKQGSASKHEYSDDISEGYLVLIKGDSSFDGILPLYNTLIDKGVAPEMARMILPQSMMTQWIWSGNLLAFAHVYKERIDPHAQLEAQWFAQQLDQVIRPLFPVSWQALVGRT